MIAALYLTDGLEDRFKSVHAAGTLRPTLQVSPLAYGASGPSIAID